RMRRQRAQNFVIREGNVQEESEARAYSALPQLLRKRDDVIIVHPDEIVRPKQRQQLAREELIHLVVRGVLIAAVAKSIQEVVKERPERAVREPGIATFEEVRRHSERGKRDPVASDGLGTNAFRRVRLAIPPEPEPARCA